MKKIININFHGRVVPIEETAYEILQQYIESLRNYFANEEGRDEIINDIENRFAELFSESLKKGATCITDPDVNAIITSMGRPADFEEQLAGASEPGSGNSSGGSKTGSASGGSTGAGTGAGGTGMGSGTGAGPTSSQGAYSQQDPGSFATEPRRLYRSDNDKILGGVCAGFANYMRLDPAVVRILFVLLSLVWGAGFLFYIILWAVLPNRTLPTNARKRLFRNSDDRVLGGVASGLAAYFHLEVWIFRLGFALPLIAGVLTSIFRHAWFNFHDSIFFTGGFGGSIVVSYIVLWIVLPEASTASEKLEMRGEKVDLESIKNTIKSDLEGVKGRARDMGMEMKDRFQQVGEEFRAGSRNFANEAAPIARSAGHGIGHAIGVLFRVFFLFIAGIIAFALIMVLIGLLFSGTGILSFKAYIVTGFWPNLLIWASFFLFLVIPVVALLTWLIRRITRTRSRGHYLGYIFAGLWVIGLFCFITLAGMVINDFRYREHVEEELPLTQPVHGKLLIKAAGMEKNAYYYDDDNFDFKWDRHNFFYALNEDSMTLKTVRVLLLKSADSNYHVQVVRFSRGHDPHIASQLAGQIEFPIRQTDSVLSLPDGFTITRYQHFRNQQVLVTVAIPVGKKIAVDRNIDSYDWFTVNVNRRHLNWSRHDNGQWDDQDDEGNNWGNSYPWTGNEEYIMTNDGLSRTDKKAPVLQKEEQDGNNTPAPKEGGGFRYHHKNQDTPKIKHGKDSVQGGKPMAMISAAGITDGDQPVCLLSSLVNLN
jgi:phage shock protein PspC (stress-responsive transcriptional regulator)